MSYVQDRAKELRALPDEVLVELENAALTVHADLHDCEIPMTTDGAARDLQRALQATGVCECDEQ